MDIEAMTISDSGLLAQHLDRNARESGQHGIEYSILEARDLPECPQLEDEVKAGLRRSIGEPYWARYWVVKETPKEIGGHLYLKGSPYPSCRHRCRLGMGIEPRYRGGGLGNKLVQQALDWLSAEGSIDWVELFAFEHNEPALKLYEKNGFRRVGVVEDLFRVNGQSINDVIMTLGTGPILLTN